MRLAVAIDDVVHILHAGSLATLQSLDVGMSGGLAFSPDGKHLVGVGDGQMVFSIDPERVTHSTAFLDTEFMPLACERGLLAAREMPGGWGDKGLLHILDADSNSRAG